jgi:hypothetical protein
MNKREALSNAINHIRTTTEKDQRRKPNYKMPNQTPLPQIRIDGVLTPHEKDFAYFGPFFKDFLRKNDYEFSGTIEPVNPDAPVMIYIEQNLYYDLKNKSEGFKRAYEELLAIKEANDRLYLEKGVILQGCQKANEILRKTVTTHLATIEKLKTELSAKESNKKWIMNLVIGIVIGIFITLIVNQFFG